MSRPDNAGPYYGHGTTESFGYGRGEVRDGGFSCYGRGAGSGGGHLDGSGNGAGDGFFSGSGAGSRDVGDGCGCGHPSGQGDEWGGGA